VNTATRRSMDLSEMLLYARLHGTKDGFRTKRPFSQDMAATQAILFSTGYSKRSKVREFRKWLETNQPCVFGKVAAKNKNVFICLIEEDEILNMRKGDSDLRDTIQDYRQVWKRHALEGLSSSFIVLLVSRALTLLEPGEDLKQICRRLMELYMEVDVPDDSILTQREYVFLHRTFENKSKLLRFSTLPNIFCAQGDGRWWHDHRTPGGIMITSNALGHFMYSRTAKESLDDASNGWALENAMRTISNAHKEKKLKHTPATFLVPASENQLCPFKSTSEFAKYSTVSYQGYFHTDHLIPAVFFQRGMDTVNEEHNVRSSCFIAPCSFDYELLRDVKNVVRHFPKRIPLPQGQINLFAILFFIPASPTISCAACFVSTSNNTAKSLRSPSAPCSSSPKGRLPCFSRNENP
jgi:hypothetical protein